MRIEPGAISPREVALLTNQISVSVSRELVGRSLNQRVADILQLFDVEASASEDGIRYGGDGISEVDQPLVLAVQALAFRRFGQPEEYAQI